MKFEEALRLMRQDRCVELDGIKHEIAFNTIVRAIRDDDNNIIYVEAFFNCYHILSSNWNLVDRNREIVE